nr:uncharacterized protein LOC126528986 isoform X1 [Dermacentor andersoni]
MTLIAALETLMEIIEPAPAHVSFIRNLWAIYPEHVVGTTVVLAMAPFAVRAAYLKHHRPWYYRKEYTVVRDDDPYAKVLEEAYKDFVPHPLPK